MNSAFVHMGATLTNPESLSEAELREALTAANQQLMQRDIQIVDLQQQSLRLGQCISQICEQVLASDWTNLTTTLVQWQPIINSKRPRSRRGSFINEHANRKIHDQCDRPFGAG